MKNLNYILIVLILGLYSCNSKEIQKFEDEKVEDLSQYSQVTLGAGCFWCVEAVFQRLEGVKKVVSGYSGGHVEDPTYEQVCAKNTGHAEVARVYFDSTVVSLTEVLEVFWKTHDPTTLNRQGADVGPQYRSAIFYNSEEQKRVAESLKKELEKAEIWSDPIVTEISPLTNFYVAENFHQDYYERNSSERYCSFVITPKIEKFEKIFKDKMKKK